MKGALIAIGELLFLFLAALAGFVQRPFHVEKVLSQSNGWVRVMVFDWMLATGVAYLVLLLAEFAARKQRSAWIRPTLCVFVVLALGLIAKLGLGTFPIGESRF